MEMGDDEVGVVNEDVDRRGGHEDARQAADDEHRDERQAKSMAAVNWILAPHNVPSQLKVFTALGRAIIIVETMNIMPNQGFMPEMNM